MDSKSTAFLAVALVIGLVIGAAAGFFLWGNNGDTGNEDETYWFYINFGDGDERTAWYSGEGKSVSEGFDAAMVSAGMDYTLSEYGYLSEIGGVNASWSSFNYLYGEYNTAAQSTSVMYPNYYQQLVDDPDNPGEKVMVDTTNFISSNGWATFNGYGTFKNMLDGSVSNVFYMSMYVELSPNVWGCPNPVTDTGWMNSGPFAGAATA